MTFGAVHDYFYDTVHSYKYNFYVVLGYNSQNISCSFLTALALALASASINNNLHKFEWIFKKYKKSGLVFKFSATFS